MTTLEQTISLIKTLSPDELLEAEQYIHDLRTQKIIFSEDANDAEDYEEDETIELVGFDYTKTPEFQELFPPLTEEYLIATLETSRRQIERGEYEDARVVMRRIREKYGL